jgi:hypothetical protein
MPVRNTLAYFSAASVMKKKVFDEVDTGLVGGVVQVVL